MASPDRRKIREWMIAESLRRRGAGVDDETLFTWMMGEGYDEMESLSMLAEALGWTGAGLRGQPFWPRLSPEQKVSLIRVSRGGSTLLPPGARIRRNAIEGGGNRRGNGGKDN